MAVDPHKHCKWCGASIPVEEEFCNQKCRDAWQDMLRRRKRAMMIQFLMVAILVLILLMGSALRG